jgi:hypothetical protein
MCLAEAWANPNLEADNTDLIAHRSSMQVPFGTDSKLTQALDIGNNAANEVQPDLPARCWESSLQLCTSPVRYPVRSTRSRLSPPYPEFHVVDCRAKREHQEMCLHRVPGLFPSKDTERELHHKR